MFFFLSLSFCLPDAMWTAKSHEWHGSIAPLFYLQGVKSGLWILVSSCWKTQQLQSTASKSKMLMSMMKGPMYALYSQTRNHSPQKCTSLFKVRCGYCCQFCQELDLAPTNIKSVIWDQCYVFLVFSEWMFMFIF